MTQITIPNIELMNTINQGIKPNRLILPDNLEYEAWEEIGKYLVNFEKCVKWWIGDWLAYGEMNYGETYKQAEKVTGLQYQTLARAKQVSSKVEFKRRRLNLSHAHHHEVAPLSPGNQTRWLDKAEREGLSKSQLRQAIREEKEIEQAPPPAPPTNSQATTGNLTFEKFDVIYADPTWEKAISIKADPSKGMDLEKLCRYPAQGYCLDDAILFLWSSIPRLADSINIMEAWGFEYIRNLVWFKTTLDMDDWIKPQHELLLIGKKGNFQKPELNNRQDSIFQGKKVENQERPDIVYEIIESMYPDSTRKELFTDNNREGWV